MRDSQTVDKTLQKQGFVYSLKSSPESGDFFLYKQVLNGIKKTGRSGPVFLKLQMTENQQMP